MLINLKDQVSDPVIQELLGYAVFPNPDKLQQVVQEYKKNPAMELFGCRVEQDVIGIVGLAIHQENILEIIHIAVEPEYRGDGYGRGMILQLIEMKEPSVIKAETDEDSVDFYRNVGFTITSLGELYPGVERFQCTYEVMLIEDDELY